MRTTFLLLGGLFTMSTSFGQQPVKLITLDPGHFHAERDSSSYGLVDPSRHLRKASFGLESFEGEPVEQDGCGRAVVELFHEQRSTPCARFPVDVTDGIVGRDRHPAHGIEHFLGRDHRVVVRLG